MFRKLALRLFFLLVVGLAPLGAAQGACYFIPAAPEVEQLAQLEQWGRSLLNEFVAPIQPLPSAGVSSRELETVCHFDVRLDASGPISLSLVARNAPVAIDGVETLSAFTPANVEQALLRIIWDAVPPQHEAMCRKYQERLRQQCGGARPVQVLSVAGPAGLQEAESVVWGELEALAPRVADVEVVAERLRVSAGEPWEARLNPQTEGVILFELEGDRLKQPSSMWAGFADIQVELSIWRKQDSGWQNVGSFASDPQRLPVRKWSERDSAWEKHFGKAAKKLTNKWDERALLETFQRLTAP